MKNLLEKTAQTVLETAFGKFDFAVYRENETGKEHIVLVKAWNNKIPLVRIHSECATGDLFGSKYCDCGEQLHLALKLIAKDGGIVIYLRQEGRGLGLTNKILAYELQRQGADTVEANLKLGRGIDERNYDIALEILRSLRVDSLRLLTNNPRKIRELEDAGLSVVRVPLQIKMSSARAKRYLKTKKEKMGHQLI